MQTWSKELVWNSWLSWERAWLSVSNFSKRLSVQPRNQQTKPTMKDPNFTQTKKACKSKAKMKVMMITFFDQKGLVNHEFMPWSRQLPNTSGRLCGERSYGCSTVTTCQHTPHSIWYCIMYLLALSHAEDSAQRNTFCLRRRNQGNCDKEGKEPQERGLCWVLPWVAGAKAEVH